MAQHDLPVWVHPMRGRAVSRLRERENFGGRDLVQLRLALRDHGLHDAADLFGLFDELPTFKIIAHHMGGMIRIFAGKIDLGFRRIFFGTPERNPVAEDPG